MGAYFSGAVALLIDVHLIIAGIGHVTAWGWQDGALTALMQPTLARIPGASETSTLLVGSLGIGFAAEKVQHGSLELATGVRAVLELQSGLIRVGDKHTAQPLERSAAFYQILSGLDSSPSVLVVIQGLKSQ